MFLRNFRPYMPRQSLFTGVTHSWFFSSNTLQCAQHFSFLSLSLSLSHKSNFAWGKTFLRSNEGFEQGWKIIECVVCDYSNIGKTQGCYRQLQHLKWDLVNTTSMIVYVYTVVSLSVWRASFNSALQTAIFPTTRWIGKELGAQIWLNGSKNSEEQSLDFALKPPLLSTTIPSLSARLAWCYLGQDWQPTVVYLVTYK